MGPVWVDMFYTWQADGKLSPKIKLELPSPGLAGPADVLRDTGQGRERGAREEVHRLRGEPRGAGRRHRQAVQLVSGHRPEVRAGEDLDPATGTSSSPTSRRPSSRSTGARSRCRTTSPTSSKATSASCSSSSLRSPVRRALSRSGRGHRAARRPARGRFANDDSERARRSRSEPRRGWAAAGRARARGRRRCSSSRRS